MGYSCSAGPSSSTKRSLVFAQDRLLIRGLVNLSPSKEGLLKKKINYCVHSPVFVILSETKDPYSDQESNNPRSTNDKALVICTLEGFFAGLPFVFAQDRRNDK